VEIDVATFEEQRQTGGVTTAAARTYSPPAARTIANVLVEGIELLVFHSEGGPTLVGAVELVSPANKDRDDARRAFATKCASYLHHGAGGRRRHRGIPLRRRLPPGAARRARRN
jgi:hypothetical protein